MRVLFIVHATSWCDNRSVAAAGIQGLISSGDYDSIVEVTSSRPDIRTSRYVSHQGTVLTHEGISPVPFLRDQVFGEHPIFPEADEVTLAGGVLNSTGGGCLNFAFDCLIKHQQKLNKPLTVTIPIRATYQAGDDGSWQDRLQVEQALKDLVWKLMVARISFTLMIPAECLITWHSGTPLIQLNVDTAGVGGWSTRDVQLGEQGVPHGPR